MKIVTWAPTGDTPASQAWLARILVGRHFLPVLIGAATEDDVRRKAQAFWDEETAKYARRSGRKPATVADAVIERVGRPDPVEPFDSTPRAMSTIPVPRSPTPSPPPAEDFLDLLG